MPTAGAKIGHLYGKALGSSLVEPTSWMLWDLRESPGSGEQCYLGDGDSDWVGGGLNKGTVASAITFSERMLPIQTLP